MRNWAASAPQATRNADNSMLGKVHRAESALPPACSTGGGASSFRNRTGVQDTMARDQIKSASLHSFHESHTEPTAMRIPFQQIARGVLAQLFEHLTDDLLEGNPHCRGLGVRFVEADRPR